jgi:uncharacterized protein YndB with AHSA1/START domain
MLDTLIDARKGEVRRTGETYEIAFERRLKEPVESVWAALTVPEQIACWLASADVDLRVGGRFNLHWTIHDYRMEGVITELDPPRLIAWTWPHEQHPKSIVRWELAPEGDGCRLLLTQSGLTAPPLKNVAAGWHTHLEGLPGAAAGVHVPWQAERERELATLYANLPPA